MSNKFEIREAALKWLCETNATHKADAVQALGKDVLAKVKAELLHSEPVYSVDTKRTFVLTLTLPGIPSKPELVSPRTLEKRSMKTLEGRVALVHALAHIEFNAINLALDAIWRFNEMPETYYLDWLKVAAEEAYHFTLLNNHLISFGYQYGDFSGHNSLWEMVDKTKGCVLARMALVPRTMEARGLDANPQLRNKLAQAGDLDAAAILDIILRDEIGHVAIGNYWFNWLCMRDTLEPLATFERLRLQYEAPKLRGPFNLEARRQAGFTEAELDRLIQTS
jgi:uncharacterized ferritin-like protein (DUF455 family)